MTKKKEVTLTFPSSGPDDIPTLDELQEMFIELSILISSKARSVIPELVALKDKDGSPVGPEMEKVVRMMSKVVIMIDGFSVYDMDSFAEKLKRLWRDYLEWPHLNYLKFFLKVQKDSVSFKK